MESGKDELREVVGGKGRGKEQGEREG